MLEEHRLTSLHRRKLQLRDRLNAFVLQSIQDKSFDAKSHNELSVDGMTHLASFFLLRCEVVGGLRTYQPQLKEQPACLAWYMIETILGLDGELPNYKQAQRNRQDYLKSFT